MPEIGIGERPAGLTDEVEHSISSHIRAVYQERVIQQPNDEMP